MKRKLLIVIIMVLSVFLSYRLVHIDTTQYNSRLLQNNKVTDVANSLTSEVIKMKIDNKEDKLSDENSIYISNGWEKVWEDNFDTRYINTFKWNVVRKMDNYNNELQCYLPNNVKQCDGNLYIVANNESVNKKQYTSGMVNTHNKYSFCYGKIEARIKLLEGKGLFPAIWLLPEKNNKSTPEIDIMEMLGNEPSKIYGVNHFCKAGNKERTYNETIISNQDDFHIYSFEWEEDKLSWFVDGELFHSTEEGIPNEEMYIIINLAVGGDWPGEPDETTIFPQQVLVDYIRVYKK